MIKINVRIDADGNIVTVEIPQVIPEEKHLEFDNALEELENMLGASEREPMEHYEAEHVHDQVHIH